MILMMLLILIMLIIPTILIILRSLLLQTIMDKSKHVVYDDPTVCNQDPMTSDKISQFLHYVINSEDIRKLKTVIDASNYNVYEGPSTCG